MIFHVPCGMFQIKIQNQMLDAKFYGIILTVYVLVIRKMVDA
ncbi:MAG: hypothetical protein ACYC54_15695 [Sedimentisphaerales bacterium]